MNSARSWLIFGAAAFAYLIAIVQRTSFGVAGVEATERFGVAAAVISSVAVAQIVIYAVLQIPVGVLVDKIGPTPLIVGGAVVMATGQGLLAFAPSIEFAILARALVGVGDAATFVSVIRLLPGWFSGPIVPQLSQWVGMIGQLGQIVSAFPFALLLNAQGWTTSFAIAAGASLVAAAIALGVVRRAQEQLDTAELAAIDASEGRFVAILRRPGTQIGFWAHLLAGSVSSMLGILWGYPFLTAGLGYAPSTASTVFSTMVIGTLVSGPIVGILIARFPLRRSSIVLAVTWASFVLWAAVLLWEPVPPIWLVTAFFFAVGVCGPASLIGLDVARSYNPVNAQGSAAGIANTGGFVGGFVAMLLVGFLLDVVDAARVAGGAPSALYSLEGFRIAFLAAFVVGAVGSVGLIWTRSRARRAIAAESGIEIAPLWVALLARGRRRPPDVRQ